MTRFRSGPLGHPAFQLLWTGSLVANVALWMQNVSAASLMTAIAPFPTMIALVQSATSLPIFLFGLPGGVLADRVDLRRWLMFTQGWMLVASLLLCVATFLGGMGPWGLLALTFALATGNALNSPAWQTASAEAVPRALLPAAVAMNSAAYNAARVVGPALAGLLTAALGPAIVFLVNAACFSAVIIAVWRWRNVRAPATMPPESLWAGMQGALRYVRHAPVVRLTLLRAALTLGIGSSIWALLPVVARDHLHLGPAGYGLLLGALGAGAVAAAFLLPRLRERVPVNNLISGSALLYAALTAGIALIDAPAVAWVLLVGAGAAWVAGMSNCTAVLQTSIPGWVRSRAAAVYILTAHGAMALGSIVWGLAATHFGVQSTLWASAATGALAVLATHRYRLEFGSQEAFTPVPMAEAPAGEVDAAAGPVSVEVTYQVPPEHRSAFLTAVREVGSARRRNGANAWRLYRTIGDDNEFVERFIVSSWLDYQRHRQRDTYADRAAKQRVVSLVAAGTTPVVRRHVAVDNETTLEAMPPLR